jgi:multidrug transporter EmrE-like cation transporter
MSLAFVLVLLCSGFFFHEAITAYKVAGLALIIAGIVIGSQG